MTTNKPREFWFNFKIGDDESCHQDVTVSILKNHYDANFHVIELTPEIKAKLEGYDTLKQQLEKAKAVIGFYADIENWTTNSAEKDDNEFICIVPHDLSQVWEEEKDMIGGKLARETLKKWGGV